MHSQGTKITSTPSQAMTMGYAKTQLFTDCSENRRKKKTTPKGHPLIAALGKKAKQKKDVTLTFPASNTNSNINYYLYMCFSTLSSFVIIYLYKNKQKTEP